VAGREALDRGLCGFHRFGVSSAANAVITHGVSARFERARRAVYVTRACSAYMLYKIISTPGGL